MHPWVTAAPAVASRALRARASAPLRKHHGLRTLETWSPSRSARSLAPAPIRDDERHRPVVAREEFGAEDLGLFARAEDDDPTTCVEAIVQVDALAAIGVDAQLATGEHRAGDASGSKAHRKPRLGFR